MHGLSLSLSGQGASTLPIHSTPENNGRGSDHQPAYTIRIAAMNILGLQQRIIRDEYAVSQYK